MDPIAFMPPAMLALLAMDPVVLVPSVILALLALAGYCVRCLKTADSVDVQVMASLVMNAIGSVAGALLIIATLNERVRKAINDLEVYILLAGVVVLGLSGRALLKDVIGQPWIDNWRARRLQRRRKDHHLLQQPPVGKPAED